MFAAEASHCKAGFSSRAGPISRLFPGAGGGKQSVWVSDPEAIGRIPGVGPSSGQEGEHLRVERRKERLAMHTQLLEMPCSRCGRILDPMVHCQCGSRQTQLQPMCLPLQGRHSAAVSYTAKGYSSQLNFLLMPPRVHAAGVPYFSYGRHVVAPTLFALGVCGGSFAWAILRDEDRRSGPPRPRDTQQWWVPS